MKSCLEFELGTVQFSGYDNDFQGVQVDALGGQSSGMTPYHAQHWLGLISKPIDPSAAGASQALHATRGPDGYAWYMHDPRVMALLPICKPGETFVHGIAAPCFTRYHADGKITHFTTVDGTKDGQSVYNQTAPTGFRRIAPWGAEFFDKVGWHIRHHAGARIDLGGMGGLPSPADALSTYVSVSAQSIRLNGGTVKLGAGPLSQPIAKAPGTIAALAAINAALIAIDTALVAMGKLPPFVADPTVPGTITAATAAITAATTALVTTAVTEIPSQSASAT